MSVPLRPLSLTITAVGIFLLAMWNLWRAWLVAQQSALLLQLGVTLDPRVRLVMAIVWGLAFLALALGLWQRRAVVRTLLPLTVLLYGCYHLLLLLFFAPSPAARQGWVMQLALLLAATGWTAWVCLRAAHRGVWTRKDHNSRGRYPFSPLTFKVVQREHDGESKD